VAPHTSTSAVAREGEGGVAAAPRARLGGGVAVGVGVAAEGPPGRGVRGPQARRAKDLPRGEGVISDCHPSEGASKNRTQIPIINMFYLF
jgi:hypothetical protein